MRMCVACAPFSRSRSRSREPAQRGRGAARGVAGAGLLQRRGFMGYWEAVYSLGERVGWGLGERVWAVFLTLLRGVVEV
jgi:hypothetical protein